MNQIIRLLGALALLILTPVFVYAQESLENISNKKSASRGGYCRTSPPGKRIFFRPLSI